MFKVVHKDLFESGADVLGHGVNLQGVMGAGIAKIFAEKYPHMYRSYRSACRSGMLQLGYAYMYANPPDSNGVEQIVANIATQQFAGRNAQYYLVECGVRDTVDKMLKADLKTLALPQIGCGIGGLDWKFVRKALEVISLDIPEVDIEVYILGKEL